MEATHLQDNTGTTGWRYTYDYRNRLIEAESKTTGDFATVAQYLYDGLNRRVKKNLTDGGATDMLYLYDGWQRIEERDANTTSTILRQYVYGGQYIDEIILKVEYPGGTEWLFYLQDANYNVVALADANGAI